MIYISAQPDDLYFLWQLEVQLFNFNRVKIPPNKIHVLIAFDPKQGLRPEFEALMKLNNKALFFAYPDTRERRSYLSSIRPNVLKQHFKEFPDLANEVIFYHDSDIILRERLSESLLKEGNTWYVSDTRNYISPTYIKKFGEEIFYDMCAIVNVDPKLILANEDNAGGAQYVIKDVTYQFWEKVELDSEKLFNLLNDFNTQLKLNNSNNPKLIQAWCADMWAVLWNGLKLGYFVKIHQEMAFCWPYQSIDQWDCTKILHNAGITKENKQYYFFKSAYKDRTPYHENFYFIKPDSCSAKYASEILLYGDTIERYNLSDVTFIFTLQIKTSYELTLLDINIRFLTKQYKTNILVLEQDDIPRVNKKSLPHSVRYLFFENRQRCFDGNKLINRVIGKVETSIVCISSIDAIANPNCVREAVKEIREGRTDFSFPFDGYPICATASEISSFNKNLSYEIFEDNLAGNLHNPSTSCIDCCFISKDEYISSGIENLKVSPMIAARERTKRMRILGYKMHRAKGNLISIYHRNVTANFIPQTKLEELYDFEYLKVCNMSKIELENYVNRRYND